MAGREEQMERNVVLNMRNERTRRFLLLTQLIHALHIEYTTGMIHSRGSMLKIAQQHFGITQRTKKGAYDALIKIRDEEFPEIKAAKEAGNDRHTG